MASKLSLLSSSRTPARCSLGALHARRPQVCFPQAVPVARFPAVAEGEVAAAVAAAAGVVDVEAET